MCLSQHQNLLHKDVRGVKYFYFQGMPWKLCVGVVLFSMVLLHAPVLWFSGLPLPTPPEDSLRVPLDGELLWPAAMETFAFCICFACLKCLRTSETKLAKTICKNISYTMFTDKTNCQIYAKIKCFDVIVGFDMHYSSGYIILYSSFICLNKNRHKSTKNMYLNRGSSYQKTCNSTAQDTAIWPWQGHTQPPSSFSSSKKKRTSKW